MVPGDYPLHNFYGVIGTRPSFGAGKLYPEFSTKWRAKGYGQVSVSVFRDILTLTITTLTISRGLIMIVQGGVGQMCGDII